MGTGIRRKVAGTSCVPNSWHNLLRLEDNKKRLFEFLANIERTEAPKRIIVTKYENVVSNKTINTDGLPPCTYKEAYTRLSIHAKDAASEEFKNVIIKSTDTDVVAIGLTHFNDLNIENFGLPLVGVKAIGGFQYMRLACRWNQRQGLSHFSRFYGL